MSDKIMMELAKMQTRIRGFEQEVKSYKDLLLKRDEEITELRKKVELKEIEERMMAKNKSYLELKVLKDQQQIEENKKLKEGNKKNDDSKKDSSRRKK
jgi:gluconate kinase